MNHKLQCQADSTIPEAVISGVREIVQEFLEELRDAGIQFEDLPEVLFAETIGNINCIVCCKTTQSASLN